LEGLESREAHLRRTRATEVRVVGNVEDLREPPGVEKYRAKPVDAGFRVNDVERLEELRVKLVGEGQRDGMVHVVNDKRFAPSPS